MLNAKVIGLGRSGIATARLLKQEGWQVTISERNISESLQNQQQTLATEGITVKLGDVQTLDDSELPKLIVVSPGVPWDIPILIDARNRGIDTIGELELAWRYLKSYPWVGITGTNGKTTTTSLIAAIFQTAGLNAPACGNIGYAACEIALKRDKEGNSDSGNPIDWIIGEISSYQIESSRELTPKIGIWTTFTPDHLNRHKTLENYYDIKASLLVRSQIQILNGDDPYLRDLGTKHWPNAYWTSVQGKYAIPQPWIYIQDGWVVAEGEKIVEVASLKMVGNHNQQNLLMAVAAARLAGIDKNAIANAIANFSGVSHRLEHIITCQGIDFINDSKATNYDAAQVGLSAVKSPTILIAGGEAKAGDDTQWLETIQAKAAAVLLIGDAASAFAERLKQVGYSSYEIVETMAKAVPRSFELAQEYNASVVLLSPACASFDQYQSFEHRGDDFRQLCLELLSS
ncbi:MAG TPA: UDP-N-acetylmuramoyl-L-alanine--D-glutamate ligase [Cyanobacteria bacterium UBA11149]|nr:UDP-N-acetylmuramoyl-L-alanine--D-glutamate ligase [Cyanobacteria bacterium UBA11367]HBE59109.1 UDP-N-acetylmuramoyl-L-alanine--D-glutamate ligase [Cyanobacteria bacterium UBA11366]HBK64105.1 UDP-N-acetylmuramoyl-L-alanine--D-glutamate ligase [Cyanobacteria bacterium UBA11166]HBR74821.1 UDP-N-acetylmuramoyl-L-alanine--D-glutamate ligase [Cyanobacteria bacterium UBA11159]HBS67967.1 UDP-N-acetylmuramoyl-L-alanine--D-glutamate ligase [Cyanobacteria bacterium UBA11153]HBW87463.1 UDP-N-acetylmur